MVYHKAVCAPGVVAPTPRQPAGIENVTADALATPVAAGSVTLSAAGVDVYSEAAQLQSAADERALRGARLWELVYAAQSGDDRERDVALHTFCKEAYPYTFHFTLSLVGNWHLAEDITQEAFIRFTGHLESIEREADSPLSLLFKVAKRLVIDHGKSRNYRTLEDPVDDTFLRAEQPEAAYTSPVEEALERWIVSQDIARLLARLNPPILRTILELRFLEGLTSAETVYELRTTPRMVRNLEAQALARMKELLQDSESDA